MIDQQSLPASVDAERAILGAILLDNYAMDQAQAALTADVFSLDSHRRIYSAMVELAETGKPIDFVSITEVLGQRKEIESVGGVVYVTSLTDGLPRVKNIKQYCDICIDKYLLRQVIFAAHSAEQSAYEGQDTGRRILAYLSEQLLTLEANGAHQLVQRTREFSDVVMKRMDEMREKRSRLIGFSLAIEGVNHRTTGVRKKELAVIGGRPGQGKTSWAVQIAVDNCIRGNPVAFFSLEMDKESLLERIFSSYGAIEYQHVRIPYLQTDVDRYALKQFKDHIDEWPLFIDDDADGEEGMTLRELCARMRLLKRQQKVELFIIDYVQLIGATASDQRTKVMKVMRKLRRFAKVEDVAIIALSQMPRPRDHKLNTRPTMFDLLESGEIEQAAHIILMLYWPTDEQNNYTHEDEIVIAKQRNGETWNELVEYVGKFVRYQPRKL